VKYALAYDLGTGGLKASLFDSDGRSAASAFVAYETFYGAPDIREQRPEDWWNAMKSATRALLSKSGIHAGEVSAIGMSGHSLGAVPVSEDGNLLLDRVPIWSDRRAKTEAAEFFKKIDNRKWYETTGNGFPEACYSIFKLMRLKRENPEIFARTYKAVGTKDYCNFKMTGRLCTDNSYASGCGAYNLLENRYEPEFIEASGIGARVLPEISESDKVIGGLLKSAAEELGLAAGTPVVCGGVDNSCMALGAGCFGENRAYMSLGSSAWIAVSGSKPILDFGARPYVFSHVAKGKYASATCIFSAGSSLRWVRDILCPDLVAIELAGGRSAYAAMDEIAAQSPAGANGVVFNPSLAGGSMIEASPDIRGSFAGLSLSSTRADIIRAAMEGVAFNMRHALDVLRKVSGEIAEIPVVGGGGKSALWLKIFADVFGCAVSKSAVDQDAASLGAAALAFKGAGVWKDFSAVERANSGGVKIFHDESVRSVLQERRAAFAELAKDLAKYPPAQ